MKQVLFNILSVVFVFILSACASTPTQDDPLKNTKKLVTQGHKSLYENGAFHIPNTSISLIPAGPDAVEFAMELGGLRAKQSFMTSLKNAADSVSVVSVGTQKTYQFSKGIFDGSNAKGVGEGVELGASEVRVALDKDAASMLDGGLDEVDEFFGLTGAGAELLAVGTEDEAKGGVVEAGRGGDIASAAGGLKDHLEVDLLAKVDDEDDPVGLFFL